MKKFGYNEDCYILGRENANGFDYHKVFYSIQDVHNYLEQLKKEYRITTGYFLFKGMNLDYVDDI